MAVNESGRILPVNKYAANAKDYDKMAPVEDSFTTRTAVNPTRYPEVYQMLLAYPKGFPMVVPYYHRQDPSIDQRSFKVSLSMDDDTIHEDLTKVHNLEMKLEEPIQFSMQEDDKSAQLTGGAIMYPGLEPYEGDLFFMEVDNGQSVVMIINSIEPTTYRQERYYRIKFHAYRQLTKELLERIESSVTESCYFERRKYFGESQLSLLSSESWMNLKELEKLRKSLSQDLVNFFYDRDAETFMRPDGIYDPYIVEYLRSKLTVKDDGVHPLQLVVPLQDYYRTIWYKFTLAENCEDLTDVWRYCITKRKDPRVFTSDFNYLVNRDFLVLCDSGDLLYPDLSGASAGNGAYPTSAECGCTPKDSRYPHLIRDRCIAHSHHPDNWLGYHRAYPECPICSSEGGVPTSASALDVATGELLFTEQFYLGYEDSGTDTLERMIIKYLRYRTVEVPKVLDMVRRYRKLGTGTTAFYKFALYLELIDFAIVSIK